jgi:hypothetical protein
MTPLSKKLGIRSGSMIHLVDAPDGFLDLLEPLPDNVHFVDATTDRTDIVHVFANRRDKLELELYALRDAIQPAAVIWVSWPKKASKVPTDITEDTIREIALPIGLVDVKVCAVDAIWSGLKLVIRKELR